MKVSFSLPQSKMADSLNVFISGLPRTYGESELGVLAATYGEVVNCKVLRGECFLASSVACLPVPAPRPPPPSL